MLGWILVAGVAVLGVPTLIYLAQDSLLFFPQPLVGSPRPIRPAEDLAFDTADGVRLRGWLVKATTAPAPLVIYYGGNAEEVSGQAREQGWPVEWSLALVNYRGYGGSEGAPSEQSLFADALLVFDVLASRPDVDARRIVLFGRSLGSAVAAFVAAERRVAGVILVSPFDSMTELGRYHYPWLPVGLLLRHRFDSRSRAPKITAPMIAIVAGQDRIIPNIRSKRLFDSWGGPRHWVDVPDADHNDISAFPSFWGAVSGFLDAVKAGQR
jgi:pimeloyl-ACP methyl ester carboxylesterase